MRALLYAKRLSNTKDNNFNRVQGSQLTVSDKIIEHQDVKRMLLEINTTEALVYYCAHLLDVTEKETEEEKGLLVQRRADFLLLSKAWCTDNAQHYVFATANSRRDGFH